jgi:hypothetical protein
MTFDLNQCLDLLERTPAVLDRLLRGLGDDWTRGNEGPDTWSPYDVVGHLIHGERTDWMARMDVILGDGPDRTFVPFDRFAQFEESKGKSLDDLLDEFAEVRAANVARVRALALTDALLDRTGTHPKFGTVTLRQLLATWTTHDLDHIVQIARVMAQQVGPHIGPWVEYIRVVRERVK